MLNDDTFGDVMDFLDEAECHGRKIAVGGENDKSTIGSEARLLKLIFIQLSD